MSRISSSDNLFATAYHNGIEFFKFSGRGISDLNELVSKVRDHSRMISGMVTLTVRNGSRGWSENCAIYLS